MLQGKNHSWRFLGQFARKSLRLKCDFTNRTAAPPADQAGTTVKVGKSMTWNSAQRCLNAAGTQLFLRPENYLEPKNKIAPASRGV
jgi:hypothetical protein